MAELFFDSIEKQFRQNFLRDELFVSQGRRRCFIVICHSARTRYGDAFLFVWSVGDHNFDCS